MERCPRLASGPSCFLSHTSMCIARLVVSYDRWILSSFIITRVRALGSLSGVPVTCMVTSPHAPALAPVRTPQIILVTEPKQAIHRGLRRVQLAWGLTAVLFKVLRRNAHHAVNPCLLCADRDSGGRR